MTDQTNKPDDAPSLDEQLDSLLARIEREEPGFVPEQAMPRAAESEAPEDDSLDAMIDRQVDDAIAAAESVMENAPAPPGAEPAPRSPSDDLADQVQAMLDEADEHRYVSPDELTAADHAHVEEIDAELSGSFHAPDAFDHEPLPARAPVAAAASSAHDDPDLAELDRLLADEADDAIAGDFESPQDVSSADPTVQAHDDDDAMAGSFESPDDVRAPAGSARGVAHELDDQPELAVAARSTAAAVDEDRPSLVVRLLPRFEWAARHACAVINMPLNSADAEIRFAIGIAGAATAAIALTMISIALFH